MCTLKLHATVIDTIDRARKDHLWRGSDANAKGKPLIAWPKVTTPNENGGIGVRNLKHNQALLMIRSMILGSTWSGTPTIQMD